MFDIGKFARITPSAEGALHFSIIDPKQLRAVLNEFCDGIESGKIIMQSVEADGKVVRDDYLIRHFTLTFAERCDGK